MKSISRLSFIILTLLVTMSLAACGGTTATVQPTQMAAADPTEAMVSGDIAADGSSTVFPLMTAAAEEYSAVQPEVRISVGESGTGGGFKKFCGIDQAPSIDISDASRAIKDSEKEACTAKNVEYIELLVAYDGLTVVANPANDYTQCLSVEQLGQLFRPEDEQNADTWADLDPSWPAEPIKFFVPDPDSGTRDFMIEAVIAGALGLEGDAANIRQDDNTSFSSDDNVLLEGVGGEEFSLGFFGFAYYVNSQDKVRAIAVENADGECVLPSNETVQDGSYNPLSRPLYIYVNKKSLLEKPQVADFVKFLLGEDGFPFVMSDVGYSMPPDGTYEANMTIVEDTLK